MKHKERARFEKHGGTYSEVNGVLLPNLVSTETNYEIGAWGQRYLNYIKQRRKVFYLGLKTSCKLNSYLHEVDVRAQEMYDSLVTQLKPATRHYRATQSRQYARLGSGNEQHLKSSKRDCKSRNHLQC